MTVYGAVNELKIQEINSIIRLPLIILEEIYEEDFDLGGICPTTVLHDYTSDCKFTYCSGSTDYY